MNTRISFGPHHGMLIATMYGVLAALLGGTPASSQYHPIEHAITVGEHRFLWYAEMRNTFDSATLRYTIGEVVLHTSSSNANPIFLAISAHDAALHRYPGSIIPGIDQQGTDTVLQHHARTVAFSVPPSGESSVSFLRLPHIETCHPFAHQETTDTEGQWDPRRARFTVGKGRIHDTTSFIVELIDDNSGARLCTLDSITVLPNPHSDVVPCIGTQALEPIRSAIQLPASAKGKTVYIRVRPVRYGPTPHGMVLSRYPSPVPLTRLLNHGAISPDSNEYWLDHDYQRLLYTSWASRFFQHLDDHIDSTGCYPYVAMLGATSLTGTQHKGQIASRLAAWSADTTAPASCHDAMFFERQWYMATTDSSMGSPKQNIAITSYSPTATRIDVRVFGDHFEAVNTHHQTVAVNVHIINVSGNVVETSPSRVLAPGASSAFSVAHLGNGAYIALVHMNGSPYRAVPILRVR